MQSMHHPRTCFHTPRINTTVPRPYRKLVFYTARWYGPENCPGNGMAGFYGVVAVQPSSFSDTLLCTAGYFFFKQKTAYEIMPSLVGSEMCIRDRLKYETIVTRHPSPSIPRYPPASRRLDRVEFQSKPLI